MNLRPHRREEPEINLVPMIDVVLVLLIFFMIATRLHHQSELEIHLPEASAKPIPGDLAQLQVDIDASGRYAVNGTALATTDVAMLKDKLSAVAGGRMLPLTISADARSPYQAVVTVMDIAGQLGIKQLGIATIQQPSSSNASPHLDAPQPSP
ncbi:MAG: biopolymer transporter ExbD [Candidatus Competibacter denitrificans]